MLGQFLAASKGGIPMPNIPQMNSVWSDLGQAWVKSTKGSGATPAASAFKTRPVRSPTRSASTAHVQAGALRGARLLRVPRKPLSTATAPTPAASPGQAFAPE